jgi:uncharacterized protein with PIN domain
MKRMDGGPCAVGPEIAFFCDAMLGGLSKWLRAAGYDAAFEHGIDDPDLLARGMATGRVVLSSDGGIFERNVVRRGRVRALFVPRGLRVLEQLAFVLRELALPMRAPRCMGCGGALVERPKAEVATEVPEATFAWCERYWRCAACAKLFWRGTHWRRIQARLGEVEPEQANALPEG